MAIITSLDLVAGVQGHVTVANSSAGDAPLPDADITWGVTAGLAVALTVDPAGGFFVNATEPGTGAIQATYSFSGVTVPGPSLPVTVTAAVTPVYLSP